MSEEPEIKLDLGNDDSSQEPEFSDVEIEAMEHGWNPDGAKSPDRRNLSAEEFMDRKPLYDKIHANEKKMKELQEGMEALRVHHERVAEVERMKAEEKYKAMKAEALESGNFEEYVELDDKIAEVRATAPAKTQEKNTVFEAWVEKNNWYGQDAEMKQYADTIGNGYAALHPNAPLTDIYEHVEKETKKRFPEHFSNPARDEPSPVEGGNSRGRKTNRKISAKDLPEEDRRMMRQILRAGGITEEQYLKEYAQLNSQ